MQGTQDQIQRITSSITQCIQDNAIHCRQRQTLYRSHELHPDNDLIRTWRKDTQRLIPASVSNISPHQRPTTLRHPMPLQRNNGQKHYCLNLQAPRCLVQHIHRMPKQLCSSVSALPSQLTGPSHKTSTIRCVHCLTCILMSQQHISPPAK